MAEKTQATNARALARQVDHHAKQIAARDKIDYLAGVRRLQIEQPGLLRRYYRARWREATSIGEADSGQ